MKNSAFVRSANTEQVVGIGIVVPEIDIFASSTGEYNIISLDHMKKLKHVWLIWK